VRARVPAGARGGAAGARGRDGGCYSAWRSNQTKLCFGRSRDGGPGSRPRATRIVAHRM